MHIQTSSTIFFSSTLCGSISEIKKEGKQAMELVLLTTENEQLPEPSF